MATGYEYKARFSPRENQKATVEFLLDHPRAFVLNDVRTGKTLSSLWAADILRRQGQVRRVLIVGKKSTLYDVWAKELSLSFPREGFAVLEGTREKKRMTAADLRLHYLIVNPESLFLLEGHLPEVDFIIADEATWAKNYRARCSQALLRISKDKRLVLMTATPAPQAPTDAYSLVRIQRGGRYISFGHFRDLTMIKTSQFDYKPKHDAAETVAREMRPSVRFLAEDCYDVPDVTVVDRQVELTKEQTRLVKEFQAKAFASLEGKTITAANAATALSKCLQVMAGGVYGAELDDERPAYAVDAAPLFEFLRDTVEETDGPVLIYAPFRISAAVIALKLQEAGHRTATITAGTTALQRAQIFEQLRQGHLDCLVAIPQTVQHGLDLSVSNTIVWVSPPFSQEVYYQANARISGSAQKRKCVIFRVSQAAMSKSLYARLDTRRSMQDTMLEMMNGLRGEVE